MRRRLQNRSKELGWGWLGRVLYEAFLGVFPCVVSFKSMMQRKPEWVGEACGSVGCLFPWVVWGAHVCTNLCCTPVI